jgi:hypothetical protein
VTTDLFGEDITPVRAYGSHESSRAQNDEWLTPRHIIDALGPFDLDPCAPITRPWDTAARHYTIADDGMRQPWDGYVWLNPPYTDWRRWMHRLAEHGNGVALIFARTETRDFHEQVWAKADALLFLKGRLRFCRVNGKPADSAGAPSVLIAYGERAATLLANCGLAGHYLRNPRHTEVRSA